MSDINRVSVRLNLRGANQKIGEIVRDDSSYYFQYTTDYLLNGSNISPFKLKWTNEIQQANTAVFGGLFGVFADSLPDGWGRLLIDRTLRQRGTNLDEINELDRLTYVGKNGLGALTYHPIHEDQSSLTPNFNLDALAIEASNVLKGESTEALEELVRLGGSSGGARPKIMIGYNPGTDVIVSGQEVLPFGFDHWIIKFPAMIDPPDVANIEYAYHRMAVRAGLIMSECRLFTGASGRQYFGTKRFDRVGNDRLHLHSAAGLFHDNFRSTNIDYGNVMHAAFKLSGRDSTAYDQVLRLAAFNVLAHNHDDHSKNISFLMDAKKNWKLAPAYDLTFSRSQHGYQSMSVAGNSKPTAKNIFALAEDFDVKDGQQIVDEVETAINTWDELASTYDLSKSSATEISGTITK